MSLEAGDSGWSPGPTFPELGDTFPGRLFLECQILPAEDLALRIWVGKGEGARSWLWMSRDWGVRTFCGIRHLLHSYFGE